ncbi:MAG: ferrous iron transport protein B [Bacteroidales bacterium]|nr:ferrous iron transport protein B [Bacteroidales bacterium]
MKLSELKTGETGVIVKVLGHGGFRKRIVEMGFIKGKKVEAVLNAPLQDPVKYKLMGYEISLRHSEAERIEILSLKEAKALEESNPTPLEFTEEQPLDCGNDCEMTEKQLHDVALRKRRTINVALVGNPNCGKTSLFNFASGAHEHVGNYSGVTVDAKVGHASFEGYDFNIVDLPGTYSLSAYSPEELYVRKEIIEKELDVIINVIDSSNLERNLYLTAQLVDMNLRVVCALNMFDEFKLRGDKCDLYRLGQLFGIPMIPTSFKSGKGVDLLFHIIINMYEGLDFIDKDGNINPEVAQDIQNWHKNYEMKYGGHHEEDYAHGTRPNNSVARHIHLNHGKAIEMAIDNIKSLIAQNQILRAKYSTRFFAIKLLENDTDILQEVNQLPNAAEILSTRDKEAARIQEEFQVDAETAIMNAKYGFIHGALQEAMYEEGHENDIYQMTHFIDRIITYKYLGFPIFFFILYIMFQATFSLGQYPMDWIEAGVERLSSLITSTLPDGILKDMLIDGVIGGVGSVIVFLPQILILYAFISYMEDSGYMARAAFIMDKLMHKMGLHGKSFIPLIMGFGCNVPAVMATRTIESRRSRLITMLILPMMSCSARLPVYIMITGTFFAARYQSTIMISLYVIGMVMSIIVSRILSKWVIKGEDIPFVMELPPYRFPTAKAILRHTWEKGKQYLKKMGGIILVASILIWALGYFPHNSELTPPQQKEQSYIGHIGKAIEPIFRPCGFNWKLDVGLVAGIGAKEIIASTIGVLYAGEEDLGNDDENPATIDKYQDMRQKMSADGITPLSAISFLLFLLFYFPCIATLAAIKQESGSLKWTTVAAFYTTALAWCLSTIVYQVGSLFV